MFRATPYDREIVEAAGIDASAYTDAEISKFAHKLSRHAEVHGRVQEILSRAFAADAIRELVKNPAKVGGLHNVILSECGHPPLRLK